MGRPWGIARVEDVDGLACWKAVVAEGFADRLVIRVGSTRGFALTSRDVVEVPHFDRILAETSLLSTQDMSWDDVGTLLDDAMVLLPNAAPPRRLPAIHGFEPNTIAAGAARLATRYGSSALEIQLQTAAALALEHSLVIQVHP